MNAKIRLAAIAAVLAACNVVEDSREEGAGTIAIAPRLRTAAGIDLPATDSVYVKVSSTEPAKVWYEKTLPWSSKFVVISGIPRGTGFTVVMEGREAVAGGSAVWWRGSESAVAGAAVDVEAQSLSVPVTVVHPSVPWNETVSYGTLRDSRDGQVYRTVTIGGREWMAENLNYAGVSRDTGFCYGNSLDSCAKFGRLYTWSQSMAGAAASTTSPSGVRGICPEGWHVPSGLEWMSLLDSVGGSSKAGRQLKAASGWASDGVGLNAGIDGIGFRALPAGDRATAGQFALLDSNANWWTTSSSFHTTYRIQEVAEVSNSTRTDAFSVRCVKDFLP